MIETPDQNFQYKHKSKKRKEMAKASKSKTFIVSRDAKTGQFVPVRQASRSKPNATVVKRAPKAAYGDTKRGSKPGRYIEEKHRVSGRSVDSISKTTRKRSGTLKNLAKR